ncbi:MAG TPA: type 4a pilus biogenesis protein PilO [Thermoanaerobaculia bacterium]|nr:type 4a pilus biogenesis protein PilO [Thermoanaerobaculia bacterium]
MALKTGLEGKPWYVGLAVGLVVGGLLFFLGHWQYLEPLKDAISAQESKLADLQTKIQEGMRAQRELPQFREEVHQLELELDKLLRILPARRNTPDLLRRIRALAEQGDFTLKDFRPGQLVDKEFFSEWPINIDVDGTYHNLALFFDRIGRFSRIINVTELQIQAIAPSKLNPHTITAAFVAKTFVYKEPDLNPPVIAGPGAPPPPAAGPAARVRQPKSAGGGD